MKQDVVMKFKALLEDQKLKLVQTKSLHNKIEFLNENEASIQIEYATEELRIETWVQLCEQKSLFLRKIEAALHRINQGTFGRCKDCDRKIELSQLKTCPITLLCLDCKDEQETLELLFASAFTKKKISPKNRWARRVLGSNLWNVKVTG